MYPKFCLYVHEIVMEFAEVLRFYTLAVDHIILIKKYFEVYTDYCTVLLKLFRPSLTNPAKVKMDTAVLATLPRPASLRENDFISFFTFRLYCLCLGRLYNAFTALPYLKNTRMSNENPASSFPRSFCTKRAVIHPHAITIS